MQSSFDSYKNGYRLQIGGKFQAAGSCGNIILYLELWWKLSLNMQECCMVVLLGFRKMQLKLPKCDCVVEVHDARISFTLILIVHSGSRTFHLHFRVIIIPSYLYLSFSSHILLLHTVHTRAPADIPMSIKVEVRVKFYAEGRPSFGNILCNILKPKKIDTNVNFISLL